MRKLTFGFQAKMDDSDDIPELPGRTPDWADFEVETGLKTYEKTLLFNMNRDDFHGTG